MKLEVGGKYELNNGDVVECMEGPDEVGHFKLNNRYWYTQAGILLGTGNTHYKSVKRCIDTPETGTLKELNVKAGDVVECIDNDCAKGPLTVGRNYVSKSDGLIVDDEGLEFPWTFAVFRIISRASDTPKQPVPYTQGPRQAIAERPDTPKTWGEMTDDEKGALLLAHHEGKVIEHWDEECPRWDINNNPRWVNGFAYRVVKEHKEPREFWMHEQSQVAYMCPDDAIKYNYRGYNIIHVREVIE